MYMWLLVIRNHDIAKRRGTQKLGKCELRNVFSFFTCPPHLRSFSLLMRSCWQDMTRSSAPRGQRGLASRGVKSKLMVMMMQKKSNCRSIHSIYWVIDLQLLFSSFRSLCKQKQHFLSRSPISSLGLHFLLPGYQDIAINGTLIWTN